MSSPERSPYPSESPPRARKRVPSEESPYRSPERQAGKQMIRDDSVSPTQEPRHDSLETSDDGEEPKYAREEDVDYKFKSSRKRSVHSSPIDKQKNSPVKVHHKEGYSPKRSKDYRAIGSQARSDSMELRKKDEESISEKSSRKGVPPESPDQHKSPTLYRKSLVGDRQHPRYPGDKISDEKNHSHSNDVKRHPETVQDSVGDVNHSKQAASDSSFEESDKGRTEEKKRRKHKRSERKEVASDDDDSYDSELEDRKEAKKRRKKEEKKLRKEERRRRREERRRRREERRAEKLKVKNQVDADASDGEHTARRESHPSDDEDMQSEQKKLEIELRKKALESLKAKKGIGH